MRWATPWSRWLFLELPEHFPLFCAALSFAVVTAADWATGFEFRLSVFYLIPVTLVAWFSGLFWAVLFSVASTLSWFSFEVGVLARGEGAMAVVVWNGIMHLAGFLVVSYVLLRARRYWDERNELIEELRLALRDRLDAEQDIVAANRHLETYAHVVAHDLKTPLIAVGGFVGLVRRQYGEALGSRGLHMVEQAVAGVRRMEALIETVLKTNGVPDGVEPVNCQDVLGEVLEDLSSKIVSCGGSVRFSELPQVRANRVHVRQVFQNLVANAIKYRGPLPPEIEVRALREGPRWQFAVRDNGPGIPPEARERVFEMFERGSGAVEAKVDGLGLGLAVCRRVVESYGGRIWLESPAEGGCEFRFTLPRVP